MSSLRCRRLNHWIPLIALLGTSALPASADNFSFTGIFTHDNDVQFFNITMLSGGTITLQTFGYGGGTNSAGQTITAGGFEPLLQLFNASTGAQEGTIVPQGVAPNCAPRNPDPARLNFCFDEFGTQALSPGNYILALTQSPNTPNGNLSEGFFYVDTIPDPNFNNGFVGTLGFPGNGNWAVDILGADRASIPGTVPEPASVLLSATALLILALRVRRIRKV